MATLAAGGTDYFNGRLAAAVPTLDRATTIFRDQCTGVTWELDTALTFAVWALIFQGELGEVTRRFQALHREARARGDRYMESNLGTYPGALARLASDDPQGARELSTEAIVGWSQTGFHVQHLTHFYGLINVDLYERDGPGAWSRAERSLPDLRRSLLLRIEHVAVAVLQYRARAALAATASRTESATLPAAESLARQLARRRATWGAPVAVLVRAGVAHLRGDRTGAVGLLRLGIDRAEVLSLGLFAAPGRRHLGTLIGGDEGRAEVERADAWMIARAIKNPERMAHGTLPGFAPR